MVEVETGLLYHERKGDTLEKGEKKAVRRASKIVRVREWLTGNNGGKNAERFPV